MLNRYGHSTLLIFIFLLCPFSACCMSLRRNNATMYENLSSIWQMDFFNGNYSKRAT